MADGRHLENRYDVKFPQWVYIITVRRLRYYYYGEMVELKREIEFQYGVRCLFFQNGSSYISNYL